MIWLYMAAAFVLFALVTSVRVIRPHELGLKISLGRYKGIIAPGVMIVSPLGKLVKLDMRPHPMSVEYDNQVVHAEARITDPEKAYFHTHSYEHATRDAVRDALERSDAPTERHLSNLINKKTADWGVEVSSVKLSPAPVAGQAA